MDTDRNLLFGVLALQADFLDPARFAEACSAWAARKDVPLADLLVERGWLTAEDRGHVDYLLERKLKKHGGDARAGLAEAATDSARHSLASVADADVLQSLAALPEQEFATTAHEPEGRGRYRLTHLHAQGGIGQVWLARDPDLDRDVALKELRPERQDHPAARARFLEEARVTGQLEHPGIVPVHELVRSADGRTFYTMRMVRGRTLGEAIKEYHRKRQAGQAGPLDLRGLLTAFVAVCQAVAYAHSRKVIHRDLKPANVVLGDYGEVVLLDWGLAKVLGTSDEAEGATSLLPLSLEAGSRDETAQGQVLGTPAYMAPEQAEGRVDLVGPATDVYGLGAVLYEVLTGQVPFSGPRDEVIRRVVREEPVRPGQVVERVPAALEAVCLKALAKKSAERYGSAGVLAREVERWLADEPVSAWREPWRMRAGRWVRRHQPLVAALSAALLATLLLGGGGAVWLTREQERRRSAAELALDRVAALQKEARWAEAEAALEQVEARLGESGLVGLRERLAQARADLELGARLDALRLEQMGMNNGDPAVLNGKFAAAFLGAGLGEVGDDQAEVARRVAASAVSESLVAALDDWAWCSEKARRAWVMGVARLADPHPWRDRLRDPALWEDEEKLAHLADQIPVSALTPMLAGALGFRLMERPQGEALLRSAQQDRPGDFLLNLYLGMALMRVVSREALRKDKLQEAESYLRAAFAVRPDNPFASSFLSNVVLVQGRLAEAETLSRKAIARDPKNPHAHFGLALVQTVQGKLAEAEVSYRRTLALDPKHPPALTSLPSLLESQGKWAEAEAAYRENIIAFPNNAPNYYVFGEMLLRRGKFVEAEGRLRKAVELDPKYAPAHQSLAAALEGQGKLRLALPLYQKALYLDPENAQLRARLPLIERMAALEPKLPAFLTGEFRPQSTEERLALASLCSRKRLYRSATELYAEAFATDPKLAEDLNSRYRYNAACFAALAATGKDEETAKLDDKERAGLRARALTWLQADLALWTKHLDGNQPADRVRVRDQMRHWQNDSDFVGVRERALAHLPEAERQAWMKLWADVATLLAKASGSK